ncbi:hypothetical protein AAT17_02470 [Nonlabens sp. MIC269]|uniref:hypothetical protein n=1 Tax=Nonlabens TaxID=363408 RepID=UPI0005A9A3EC|nr:MULTISPECIES: hypothetical protein [Nonlabens]ALM20192.1 hypothetical protein AAT17_02470 [Nonlabens sp. MIC269]ARN70764.1 hypothetical protein BST91_03420 [Nonlabens tegetincola]MEE2801581.1 hypothetical protein [Bacteroidota bacterium]PQJ18412.1 hypothetical protein BST93_07940 [Nonlabens tegetincola]
MTQRKRNPKIGILLAILFVGFGSWRLVDYFFYDQNIPTWRLAFSAIFIIYGLFLAYSAFTKNE